MVARHLVLAAALGGLGIVELIEPSPADAQSSTSGAIQGTVTDESTGENLVGVTIVVTSPALQSAQTAISDENGFYKIADLPPGTYLVTFYYAKLTVERSGVTVGVNKTTPVFQRLKLSQATGEIVKITDTAPAIDPTSTTQGITLDKNYLKNVPNPGRTFEGALGAAAGSQGDGLGVSFSGSSSLENQYLVDGVNTTGLTYGTVGTPVINDFIEEIEVVTGGYNAEYGRATGGVVNVVTKTGSNEFKGTIFGSFQPGLLTAPAVRTPVNASSIDAVGNNAYIADIGFEVGGPIIKDKLWYFVGVAPQFRRTDITRTTKRQTDCRTLLPSGALSACDPRPTTQGGFADGVADIDPKTGFYITDTLDEEVRSDTAQVLNILSKINYSASANNQLQLSVAALPGRATNPGIYGLASSGSKVRVDTNDVSGKWTTKLNDNKTEIEAVVGWHRDSATVDAIDDAAQSEPLQALGFGNLGVWGPGFGGETAKTNAGCFDGTGDAYPLLSINCPMNTRYYFVGGPGSLVRDVEQRLSAKLNATQRVKLLGSHEFKAGVDVENNTSDKARLYSGGAFIQNFVRQNDIRVTRWVQLKGRNGSDQANENTDPRFDNMCSTPDPFAQTSTARPAVFLCDFLGGTPGSPGTQLEGSTLNWAAFLRDSWQIRPNLTLNVGLRYEEQRLRYAGFLQHTVDALTQRTLGKNAMTLQNMWAPRLGAIYDWTQEGRSKVYVHWGRFYESIPMDINDRSFGGEVQYVQDFSSSSADCGTMSDPRIGGKNGNGCLVDPKVQADQQKLIGASGVLIAPGIKPQYLDEVVAGVEYEVLEDLKVGLSFQNRRLGRVIEDVSTDGANTYLIANPGEWSADQERNLEALIERTEIPAIKQRLQNELELFRGIRIFDRPRRDYNALQLTVSRRSKQLILQGSYTYSRVTGNYPGLISYDNGQVDPNISSQYDLIELLANRQGALPQDRPHYVKLDGYYIFDLRKQGALIVGSRIRAYSGIPENALGSHFIYGADESFLLPRGTLGRTGFDHGVDLHVEYQRRIGKAFEQDLALSVYVDVFNVYNHQGEFSVDQTYAPPVSLGGAIQNANPISGGDYEDLMWVRQIDNKGNETATPIGRNPNFRNTTSRYAPAFARIGARLTF
jgi:outer membrane receptor protein involved in Fe transport